jgi:hypothetical protein
MRILLLLALIIACAGLTLAAGYDNGPGYGGHLDGGYGYLTTPKPTPTPTPE